MMNIWAGWWEITDKLNQTFSDKSKKSQIKYCTVNKLLGGKCKFENPEFSNMK